MAVTPEFLAQEIEKAEDIDALFDKYILPKKGESQEIFLQRKQAMIEQTMRLIGKDSQMPAVEADVAKPKALDIPIIVDCLGTPLTQGYVDSAGNTYDISNIDRIPANLRWQNDGKPVVNRALNDNLDAINRQLLKAMIAQQWIIENIPPEHQNDYLQQEVIVSDDDYPENILRCPILFENFGPQQEAFIYEDGYSVSSAQQQKSPFTNLILRKKTGTPNQLLDQLAADYLAELTEYKQMAQQYPQLQSFVDATIEEKVQEQKQIHALRVKETKEEQEAIQAYTRRLAIRAQLHLERNKGMNVRHESFQKINRDCLFTMDRIRTEYPDIERKISQEEVKQEQKNFAARLNAVPIDILCQYNNIRNAYFEYVDKVSGGSLTVEESEKALQEQARLSLAQKSLEEKYPEIRYRLLLDQARGTPIQVIADLKKVSLSERQSKTQKKLVHPPFFSVGQNGNGSNAASKSVAMDNNPKSSSSIFNRFRTFASQISTQLSPATAPQAQPPANPSDYDYSFNVLLIGDSRVGKSSLLLRFSNEIYSDAFAQINADFKEKTIALDNSNNTRVKLRIWNPEQDRFAAPVNHYRVRPHAILVIFDVTDRESFDNVTKWLKEIDLFASPSAVVTLVATKCDVPEAQWKVSKEEIKALAEGLRKNVFFTSAKDNDDHNVEQLFSGIADSVIQSASARPAYRG